MPLDPLQEKIIRTALALLEARTLVLAGGCAVITHWLVERITRDVDTAVKEWCIELEGLTEVPPEYSLSVVLRWGPPPPESGPRSRPARPVGNRHPLAEPGPNIPLETC